MAKTAENPEAAPATADKGGMSIKKLIMFGVPVFLIQLVLVYFLITQVIAPAPSSHDEAAAAAPASGHGEKEEGGQGEAGAETKIYVVKDVIVNPAGTNGTRFLLTTVGFEVTTLEAEKELEAKDVQVRDALNSVLTTKTLGVLSLPENRDSLRLEITQRVGKLIRSGSLTNVYFSKFIIQ